MITTRKGTVEVNPANYKSTEKVSLWNRYIAYASSKNKERIVYFIGVIIWVPCALMVLSIFAMATLMTNYIWFVGLSMILFFANVIVHMAEVESKIFIPLFHATVLILTAIPIITYLILG